MNREAFITSETRSQNDKKISHGSAGNRIYRAIGINKDKLNKKI